ncbi:MAG: BatA and WFA domain-containing protein [Planctomycetales bacterium]|nr:BatA and WFA domain-containing protein [Planctomycetales bacterium]
MSFINSLPWGAWVALAAVPPAIIALYFLKLRRKPVEVPSTFLWTRTLEDLHVNSFWQRLRTNLLLLLQLVFLALLAVALLRPGTATEAGTLQRVILLIDNSASMGAEIDGESRLAKAKQRATEIVDELPAGSVAMVIAFSDRAQVVQSYTDHRALLRKKIEGIELTNRPTRIADALQAASGLANPPQTYEEGNPNALKLAEALSAKLVLLTDGGWQAPSDFALGNLIPEYVPIGRERPASNVGIVAFTTAENPEQPGSLQVFAQLLNSGPKETAVDLRLEMDDRLLDARNDFSIPSGATRSLTFDIATSLEDSVVGGKLHLEIMTRDDFSADDHAYAVFDTRRQSRILLVTPGNEPLEIALDTEELVQFAEVRVEAPEFLTTDEYRGLAAAAGFDLIVYDRCQPEESPAANTCYIAALPPDESWSWGETQEPVLIVDTDRIDPLVEWLELSQLLIAEGRAVQGPPASRLLARSADGPVIAVGDRLGFQDAVIGFPIVIAQEDDGSVRANTDWPRHASFPMFVQNLVQVLGNAARLNEVPLSRPGEIVELRSVVPYPRLTVETPSGTKFDVDKGRQNSYFVTNVEEFGIYSAKSDDIQVQRFAVSLCDSQESNLVIPENVELGYETVTAEAGKRFGRQEYWKWILLAGVAILMIEWGMYRRRAV